MPETQHRQERWSAHDLDLITTCHVITITESTVDNKLKIILGMRKPPVYGTKSYTRSTLVFRNVEAGFLMTGFKSCTLRSNLFIVITLLAAFVLLLFKHIL